MILSEKSAIFGIMLWRRCSPATAGGHDGRIRAAPVLAQQGAIIRVWNCGALRVLGREDQVANELIIAGASASAQRKTRETS
jgi:hypothetical protein